MTRPPYFRKKKKAHPFLRSFMRIANFGKRSKLRKLISRLWRRWKLPIGFLIIGVLYAAYHSEAEITSTPSQSGISCYQPYIIDGDTLDCNGTRIRLASIDAPEMPDHCREGRDCVEGDPHASKAYLHSLTRGQITCYPSKTDFYGRTIAECTSEGAYLTCAMVEAGHAVQRYARLPCQ